MTVRDRAKLLDCVLEIRLLAVELCDDMSPRTSSDLTDIAARMRAQATRLASLDPTTAEECRGVMLCECLP